MDLHRIGIIGLGLIGGSMGLDLQKQGHEVCGLTHKEETATRAKDRGLAQFISTDPKIIADCSIIILALPLPQLIHPSRDLLDALPTNAVVTDVGSVKKPIIKTWKNLHPNFVAGHPMAGTIQSGVEAGQKDLFVGRPWITTPDDTTNQHALSLVKELATSIGSKCITTDADTHDQAVALVSHLPVFISASLLKAVSNEKNNQLLTLAKKIASSGFADTTRVGGGNPNLGLAMAEYNNSEILNSIHSYRESLNQLEEVIRTQNWQKLEIELQNTKQRRSDFLDLN